MEIRQYLS